MSEPTPRIPNWAVAAGVSPPLRGEGFRHYWLRICVPPDVIDKALDVFRPAAIDCANDRLAAWLAGRMPGAIEAYTDGLLSRHRRPL